MSCRDETLPASYDGFEADMTSSSFQWTVDQKYSTVPGCCNNCPTRVSEGSSVILLYILVASSPMVVLEAGTAIVKLF